MTKQYQLIHIDTKEVTMCEKITIEGRDYYIKYHTTITPNSWYLFLLGDSYVLMQCRDQEESDRCNNHPQIKHSCFGIIATTNTSLQCPRVVDYVFHKWKKCFNKEEKSMGNSHLYDHITGKEAFIWGYESHSETHSLSDEEVVEFHGFANDHRLYNEEPIATKELLTLFKSTLPIKIYYK